MNIHIRYRFSCFNGKRRGLGSRLSGQNRRRNDPENIPSITGAGSAAAGCKQIRKIMPCKAAKRNLIQEIPAVKIINSTDGIRKMLIAIFLQKRIIAINVTSGTEIRHHGHRCNISGFPILVFDFIQQT